MDSFIHSVPLKLEHVVLTIKGKAWQSKDDKVRFVEGREAEERKKQVEKRKVLNVCVVSLCVALACSLLSVLTAMIRLSCFGL